MEIKCDLYMNDDEKAGKKSAIKYTYTETVTMRVRIMCSNTKYKHFMKRVSVSVEMHSINLVAEIRAVLSNTLNYTGV